MPDTFQNLLGMSWIGVIAGSWIMGSWGPILAMLGVNVALVLITGIGKK